MGMTIDDAINYYSNKNVVLTEEEAEANTIALNTMRKYQKIQVIAEKCNLKLLPKEAMNTFMKDVLEVLEDGKTD